VVPEFCEQPEMLGIHDAISPLTRNIFHNLEVDFTPEQL